MKFISIKVGREKLDDIYPYLELIAEQNGLNLNKAREFKIARKIFERSIMQN
jgi:hypothetical protein